jgi:hypothetical protein
MAPEQVIDGAGGVGNGRGSGLSVSKVCSNGDVEVTYVFNLESRVLVTTDKSNTPIGAIAISEHFSYPVGNRE